MTPLTCGAARRRLQAFHDGELSIPDQIDVGAHLDWCDDCAAMLADLQALRSALHGGSHDWPPLTSDEAGALGEAVVGRLKAERDASIFARARDAFQDLHLVYSALGAAAATAVCVIIMLGMMRFATSERPDSLAAIVNVLATPLECDAGGAGTDESACRARWAERFERANASAEQDAVFALEAVVTRQGRLTNLKLLRTRGPRAGVAEADIIESLLDAVSRSRFDDPQYPPSTRMLWLVEHATVRASSKQPTLDLSLPRVKKRAASLEASTVPLA